jgi:hypothetical protein
MNLKDPNKTDIFASIGWLLYEVYIFQSYKCEKTHMDMFMSSFIIAMIIKCNVVIIWE